MYFFFNAVPAPTTPTPPPDVPGDCPGSEWVPYCDACFLFKPDENVDWSRGHYECVQAGGESLASIRSQAENEFMHEKLKEISNLPDRGVWIGLIQTNDNGKERYFPIVLDRYTCLYSFTFYLHCCHLTETATLTTLMTCTRKPFYNSRLV